MPDWKRPVGIAEAPALPRPEYASSIRLDRKHASFEFPPLDQQRGRIFSIPWRQPDVAFQEQQGPLALVRKQVRKRLSQQVQSLPVVDRVCKTISMSCTRGALGSYFPSAGSVSNELEQGEFGTADRDANLSVLATMLACQSYCAFPVNQACEVSCVLTAQGARFDRAGTHTQKNKPRPMAGA